MKPHITYEPYSPYKRMWTTRWKGWTWRAQTLPEAYKQATQALPNTIQRYWPYYALTTDQVRKRIFLEN